METITGNITEVLLDVIAGTLKVLMGISLGEFGPIEEEEAVGVATALGRVVADAQQKAQEGGYS
jgi:hypothetical protein